MKAIRPIERSPFMLSCCLHAAMAPLGSVRCGLFFIVIALYALAGTPTPDHIGVFEIGLGAVLCMALVRSDLRVLWERPLIADACWWQAGRLVLFFGLSVPLLAGVIQGNPATLILRDMIWLGFIALPVLLAGLFSARRYGALVIVSAAAGVVLALREVLRVLGGDFVLLGAAEATAYLGNSPLVLFAAIMLAGYGGAFLMQAPRRGELGGAIILISLSFIPLCAMAMGMQRASLGLFVLSLAVIGVAGMRARPLRALPLWVIFVIVLYFFRHDVGALAGIITDKTTQVGFNRRAEEWLAVWKHISAQPLGILFGTGWGGVYNSPAVGGMGVNFTHGALSSVLLKTGLAGLSVFGLYFYVLGRRIWDHVWRVSNLRDLVFVLALICPFLIDIFLYASFKSFDFGVLLVLMAFAPRLLGASEQQILVSGSKSL